MKVTAAEPKAATSTPAAAISRAVFSRGSSGSPMARARVSTALCASSAIRTRQAAEHQQAPAPLIDAQQRGRDGDQRPAIASGRRSWSRRGPPT